MGNGILSPDGCLLLEASGAVEDSGLEPLTFGLQSRRSTI
jgi:hypothetical protein